MMKHPSLANTFTNVLQTEKCENILFTSPRKPEYFILGGPKSISKSLV